MRGMRTMERSRGKTSVSDSKVTCIAVTYQGLSPFPEIPGCNTCGDTMDEVRHNVVEAAELMLESNSTLT